MSKAWGRVILERFPLASFLDQHKISSAPDPATQVLRQTLQGHLIYEFFPALWGALDATYLHRRGATTTDGDKGEQLSHARMGLTLALSVSRNQSIKLYASDGVYSRTGDDFWATGFFWQFRWGGGL